MELKPGYKLTELGMIPDDWNVLPFRDHFCIYAGGDVPRDSLSKEPDDRYPYPIYANALQQKGLYGYTGKPRAKPDSVTITARGYLGHAEYRSEPFLPIVRLLVMEPVGCLDARFTTYAVNQVVAFASESTGVPQLTAPQLGRYAIAAPSLQEQRAIAEALSDVDELITSLDLLIAKERDVKQGAMQQLLTGKTRLPGFSEEWETKRLGEVAELYQPETISAREMTRTGFPVFGANGHVGYYDSYNHELSQVTITCRGSTCGTINRTPDRCWITGNSMVANCDSNPLIHKPFFYYLLCSQDLTGCITGTGQPQIVRGPLSAVQLLFPAVPEQAAIADVLSDMDAELSALEARRDKTKLLKQGMMQELLTGKTRLV